MRLTARIRPASPARPLRLRFAKAPSAIVPPITFPTTPIRLKVEVAQGADLTASPATWGWADATAITYTRDPLTITRGRPDESATADSCQLNMTANNRGGHWSTRNPNSPWYGLVRKGSPIRVSAEGYPRFSGFLSELPPRWDVSGNDRYAPVVARGLLYRLAQGTSPERSAMTRAILSASPTVFWPLEDSDDSTQGGPAVGTKSMVATGDVVFGGTPIAPGVAATPDLSGGAKLSADLAGFNSTAWAIEFSSNCDLTNAGVMVEIQTTGGTHPSWWIYPQVDALFGVGVLAGTASSIFVSAVANPVNDFADFAHHYRLTLRQSGANIAGTFYMDGIPYDASLVSSTLGTPQRIVLNSTVGGSTSITGGVYQVAMYSTTLAADHSAALYGYAGEQAHARFLRLCTEVGIPASTGVTESARMGPQGIKNIVDLLRECEATDSAYLYEGVNFDLIFQGHNERQNIAVGLALNYTTDGHIAPPLEPTDDDQQALNDVEVKRDGGSSARLTETSAAVENSIPNIGRRDESLTLSLYDDSQPQQAAGWRLRQGTWAGYRYPTVSLNLAAAPGLIPTVCTAGLAFRSTIANPPSDVGPDAPDLIFEGYTEAFEYPSGWDIAANCSPFGPWRVLALALDGTDPNPLIGRDDWDSCTIASDSGATITVAVSPLITTDPTEFPFNIRALGELMTVTNCSGVSSPQTLTVTRAVNGISKTLAVGTVVELVDALVMTL